jgi:hypothetical protein
MFDDEPKPLKELKLELPLLKQNAIRWIKELEKGHNLSYITWGDCDVCKIYHKQYPINNPQPNWENEYLIEWIKYFFGIADEELK